jgi:FkbM family methyltransferase
MRNPARRLLRLGPRGRESFSQSGEDLIARYAFDILGIATPSYLDIGAHHPFVLSNTASFYRAGSHGVNVEPEVTYHRLLERYRRRDVNLHAGVADAPGTMPFYVLSLPTLSTFVRDEMERRVREGVELVREIELPVLTAAEIIDRHLGGRAPDFMSIDTEGMDARILRSLEYDRHAPLVVCVEHALYGERATDSPLQAEGYRLYARTPTNSIFVRGDLWANIEACMIPRCWNS